MLFISQSAVSQSIKTLEKKLGLTLFVRSTKKVAMTKEGELLFKHVESAVNLLMRAEAQLHDAGTISGGQLRIAASDTICRYFLVPYLKKFHKVYPNVHIRVTNGTSVRCAQYLQSNEVDIIISNYPNESLSDVAKIVTLKEFMDVFVASGQAFGRVKGKLSYEELAAMPIMMLSPNTTTSNYLHNIFLKKGVDLVPDIELSSNDLLIDLAKIGLGIAFVPDYCVDPMPQELYEIELREKIEPRKLVAAYSRTAPLSEIAKCFINILTDGNSK